MFGKKNDEYKMCDDNKPHTVSRAFIIIVDDAAKVYLPIPIPAELAEANLATISQLAAMTRAADGKGAKPN